jgi:hypothetical protein
VFLGQCGPNLAAVAEAKGAAAKLIETVMRTPAIDADNEDGVVMSKVGRQVTYRRESGKRRGRRPS